MPRVANLIPMEDGRLAVILEPEDIVGDPGSITLWADDEKKREIDAHVKIERETCAAVVENWEKDDTILAGMPAKFKEGARWILGHLPYAIRNHT